MNKLIKKSISVLLVIIMFFSNVPASCYMEVNWNKLTDCLKNFDIELPEIEFKSIFASDAKAVEEQYLDGFYTYTVTDNKATIVSVDRSISGDIIIPEKFEKYVVAEIANKAFYKCVDIASISFPDNLTKVGDSAFSGCTSLATVNLNNVEVLGELVFGDTAITSIKIPNTLTEVGSYYWDSEGPFYNSALQTVTFEDNTTIIPECIFSHCANLTTVIIPGTVTTIGSKAFYKCDNLNNVILPTSLTAINNSAFEKCISLTEISFHDNLTKVGDSAFLGCTSLATVNLNNVEVLGELVFGDTAITSIKIPNTLTEVGSYYWDSEGPFYNSALQTVTFEDNTTIIPECIFSHCANLTTVIIPGTVTTIGSKAFYKCDNLNNVILPTSLTAINNSAFEKCISLTEISFPDNLTKVGDSAFSGCTSLATVNLNNVEVLGELVFGDTAITSIKIPNTLTEVGSYYWDSEGPFYNSALQTVTFEDNTTIIPECIFSHCANLTTVIIPGTVTTIGSKAFYDCSKLTVVKLPNNLLEIGNDVFEGCESLSNMNFPKTLISIGNNAFGNFVFEVKMSDPLAIEMIKQCINFKFVESLPDNSSVVDHKKTNFYAHHGGASMQDGFAINLIYDLKKDGFSNIYDAYINIKIPKNFEVVLDCVILDGEKISYEMDDSIISIPINKPNGEIQIYIRGDADKWIGCYAYLSYMEENIEYEKIIGCAELSNNKLTINAPSETYENTVLITGLALPNRKIELYIDNKLLDTVSSNSLGNYKYLMDLTNSVNGTTYKITAKYENLEPNATASCNIKYTSEAVEVISFNMLYRGQKYDLFKNNHISLYPNCTDATFEVCVDRPNLVKDLCVLIEFGTEKIPVKMFYSESEGKYIGIANVDDGHKLSGQKSVKLITYNNYNNSEFVVSYHPENDLKDVIMSNITIETLDEKIVDENNYSVNVEGKFANGVEFYLINEKENIYIDSQFESNLNSDDYLKVPSKDKTYYYKFYHQDNKLVGEIYTLPNKIVVTKSMVLSLDEKISWSEKQLIEFGSEAFKDNFWDIPWGELLASGDFSEVIDETFGKIGFVTDLVDIFNGIKTIIDGDTILDIGDGVANITTTIGGMFDPIAGLFADGYTGLIGKMGEGIDGKIHGFNNLAGGFAYTGFLNGFSVGKNLNGGITSTPSNEQDYCYDPSGYIYEAVTSNRVENAITTVYCIPYDESCANFWDAPDTTKAIVWDAEKYEQKNPIITDKEGNYAWDVPVGWWQVKCEKDGYETTYSEWLPVPPPQLDVNLGLVTTQSPEVNFVNVYKDYSEIVFSQYMDVSTINSNTISFMQSGKEIVGTWEAIDKEVSATDTSVYYAKTFKFVPEDNFSGNVNIKIANVKNYADIKIEAEYTNTYYVNNPITNFEVPETVEISYENNSSFVIKATPVAAAKNKTVTIELSNDYVVQCADKVTLDENGEAVIYLKSLLPGEVKLKCEIDGTTISNTVNIVSPINESILSKKEYSITWIIDGETTTENYTVDELIVAPINIFKKGFVFSGWSADIPQIMPEEDLTFKAMFIECDHSLVDWEIVYPATCTETGEKVKSCACGINVTDIIPATGHHHIAMVIKEATCTTDGLVMYECSCGDTYDETIAKTKEHSYTATLVNSTCINQGYTLNQCECGESFKSDYLAKTDHNDSNADGVCDNCGYELTANCSCNCHAGGIKGLIFKLILFFQKLFRMNRICEGCGIYHY